MKAYHCQDCGYTGEPKRVSRGSVWISILLYMTFLLPGLIYSLYRTLAKDNVCPQCTGKNMVSVEEENTVVNKF